MTGFRTAKPVLRALLGLALLAPSVLAPLPAVAQSLPSVSFSPTTVAPGGTIIVNVGGFTCSQPVTIDITSESDFNQVITLGSLFACKDFDKPFTLSASVPADLYRVRATDTHSVQAFGRGPLTVAAPGRGISGTATCKVNGVDTPLPNALVQLFSGSNLVARTTADGNAGYTFLGLGADATYLVEFTQFADGPGTQVRNACGAAVTTNADNVGTTRPPGVCPAPDSQDHSSWDNAYQLSNTTLITGGICQPGQSFWARLPINPGSTVFVSVANGDPTKPLNPKTRVELFRDLRKEADSLLAKQSDPTLNVRQLTASLPGAGSTGWDSNGWDSNPWDSNGWDSNPWDSNGWDSNPWDSNGWDSNPCSASACGTTGAKDAPVYSAAEQRALLAFSKHGQITRNTWDNTGDYYVRVFNTDATFDPTQLLSLSVTAGPVCGIGNFAKTTTPPTPQANPTTLILYNSDRLKANNGLSVKDLSNKAALTSFQDTLSTFSAQPNVNGFAIDLATLDPNLTNEYAQWDQESSCVPAANIVSESIHDIIAQYRNQPGSALKYVTLIGGHTGLPYRLLPDYAEIQQEKRYNPGLLDQSQSAASLGSDYVMTDNYYISFTPISHLESEINLPEANMGVGRIVETLEDVTSNLQTFNASGGVLQAKTALASGYTFVQDLAAFEAKQFKAGGLTTETGAIDAAHPDGLLISDSWTMPDLKAKVFAPGSKFDILALNWHAATNVAVAADYDSAHPTVLTTADLEALSPPGDTRFNNALIMSIGCHLGYNLVNPDVIGQAQAAPVTNPRDFVQVLSGKGAMVLGNTGYGYGDTDFMGYSERLLGTVTQELGYSDYGDAVPVGLALTRAKRNYIDGALTLTGVDKKSVEQLTFYGPPMWSVNLQTRQPRPSVAPLGVTPTLTSGGLSVGDVSPSYTLSEQILHDGAAQFFFADGGTVANYFGAEALPYRAVQPFKGFDATVTAAGTARGVAMLSADYQDIQNYRPLINLPATEEAGFARVPNSRGFTPIMPFGLNELLDQTLAVTPFQWSTPDGTGSVARKYLNSSLRLRTYYSSSLGAAAVAGPATVGNVALTSNGTLVHVEATIRGANAADISDVLLTYTAVGTNSFHNDSSGLGNWTSCNLVRGQTTPPNVCLNARLFSPQINAPDTFERHYSGDIETVGTAASPADLRILIQAVTGTGLVSVAANNGLYYQVVQAPTISTPKDATKLTLTPPSTPAPYDHSATFSASLLDLHTLKPADGQVIFTVGSQQVAVQTVNGTATATLTILGLPGAYKVTAAFAETSTLLGTTASADYTVLKKATSLAFGTTPFLVTLTDADGHLLRDEAVFFYVNGNGTSQTISAQTGRDGVAQLRGLNLPAGSYTVTAYFLSPDKPDGIPFGGGKFSVSDDRYSPSMATSTLVSDKTGPSCAITAVGTSGGQRFINITVQDRSPGSGLASVSATRLTNATLSVPDFAVGTQSPLTVTAYRTLSTLGTVISLEVVDVAGNVTNCDPALLEVGGRGEARTATASDILPNERYVTVYNGRPGVSRLEIVVNKRTFEMNGLKAGEVRTIDIAKGLHKGKNVVTVKVEGNPNGSALVLISDTAPTPAQTRRNPNDPQQGNNVDSNNNDGGDNP